ncbi:hypothetical protein [Burkholderia gladioli]|uniref:hypothetical protein n=1 Tax=Burkholderia gladioli TaxID=28095 RepID=UPI001FC88CF5|nr:hypothetical protein [Burkholderia gladioli]
MPQDPDWRVTRALVLLMGDADWPTARSVNRRMERIAGSKKGPGKPQHEPRPVGAVREDPAGGSGGSRSRGRACRRRVSRPIRLAAQTGAVAARIGHHRWRGDRRRAVAALRERGIEGYVLFENDSTRYAFTPEADFVYPAARH